MHPILARGRFVGLYLGLWVFVSGLFAALVATQARLDWPKAMLVALPLVMVYSFVCLSAWYVSRSMPLSTTSTVRLISTAVTASIISSAVWLGAARLWMQQLTRQGWLPNLSHDGAGLNVLLLAFGVLLYALSLTVSYLVAAFEQSREVERRALQVQVFAREAELRLLRTQVDPHFLFNSLHSISALTTIDPGGARRMCLQLADFLRESLVVAGENRITLARELGLAERFLSVERIRFGDRLDGDIVAEDEAKTCLVPPLLLQPLVENAVTHGVAQTLEGGIVTVRATRLRDRLTITVENPCDPDRRRGTGTGVGLANVRSRLTATHGTDANLTVTEDDGRWRVELSLPALE